jgi:hypothetical protein
MANGGVALREVLDGAAVVAFVRDLDRVRHISDLAMRMHGAGVAFVAHVVNANDFYLECLLSHKSSVVVVVQS